MAISSGSVGTAQPAFLSQLEEKFLRWSNVTEIRQNRDWAYDATTRQMIIFGGQGQDAIWNLASDTNEDLGLTDTQKLLVENLKTSYDLEAQVLNDKLREIKDRYAQSFRDLLTPEQLEKYNPQRQGSVSAWIDLVKARSN